ncbi:MAG: ferredoxin [Patescibacteria group bacterium]
MKKIDVNKNKCIGCGTCIFLAPKAFKLGKDGKSEVIKDAKTESKEVKEAIESCPVDAIS